MPEEIMQAIEQYIEAHPGTQINQERLKGMQENAKSFKDLQGKYTMKAEINGERELVQSSSLARQEICM